MWLQSYGVPSPYGYSHMVYLAPVASHMVYLAHVATFICIGVPTLVATVI